MPRSPDETDAFVGARLAGRRQAQGLTQGALAKRLGISAQQVQKYEAGTNRISASRLSRIAAALGDHPGAFFPSVAEAGSREDPEAGRGLSVARFLTATTEGRVVAESFPLIRDRAVRQAIARVVEALAVPS
jgi:transcriptional regulator with XRE-family HTH domain